MYFHRNWIRKNRVEIKNVTKKGPVNERSINRSIFFKRNTKKLLSYLPVSKISAKNKINKIAV